MRQHGYETDIDAFILRGDNTANPTFAAVTTASLLPNSLLLAILVALLATALGGE